MRLYHGTTLNRMLKILKDGYLGTEDSIWNVSEPNTTYFYTEEFFKEEFEDNWHEIGIVETLGSSEISLAIEKHNLRRVVLVFDSEDLENLEEAELIPDSSCGKNSESERQFSGKIPISLIKEIWIDKEDMDMFLLYYIGLVYEKTKLNERLGFSVNTFEDIDSDILECSEKVYASLCDYYIDMFHTIEVIEPITIERLKKEFDVERTE